MQQLSQWSELSKKQQREAKDWFNRIFKNSEDNHGNPVIWESLVESEKAEVAGKLWKYHHDRNKPDQSLALLRRQFADTKAKAKATEESIVAAIRCRLDAEMGEIIAKATAIKQRIKSKAEKEARRKVGFRKRKQEFERRLKATKAAAQHVKG